MRLNDFRRQAEEYRDMDRDAGGPWLVTCKRHGTRFFINQSGSGTDILSRARYYRSREEAEDAARKERADPVWHGFEWIEERYCAY